MLADGIEIAGAALDNGLLHIDMKRLEPEVKTRKIEIVAPNTAGNGHSQKAVQIDNKDKP